jgi:signal transduction histidine kinase
LIELQIPTLEASLGNRTISPELKRNIMLTLKESFTNILKHSRADKAKLTLSIDNQLITLIVEDNGIGIPSETRIGGNGLVNMDKRTRESGGKMTINKPSQGTSLLFTYPL